jgi:hypothetical protein
MCLTITAEINNESCCGFKLGNPQFDYIYISWGIDYIFFTLVNVKAHNCMRIQWREWGWQLGVGCCSSICTGFGCGSIAGGPKPQVHLCGTGKVMVRLPMMTQLEDCHFLGFLRKVGSYFIVVLGI